MFSGLAYIMRRCHASGQRPSDRQQGLQGGETEFERARVVQRPSEKFQQSPVEQVIARSSSLGVRVQSRRL